MQLVEPDRDPLHRASRTSPCSARGRRLGHRPTPRMSASVASCADKSRAARRHRSPLRGMAEDRASMRVGGGADSPCSGPMSRIERSTAAAGRAERRDLADRRRHRPRVLAHRVPARCRTERVPRARHEGVSSRVMQAGEDDPRRTTGPRARSFCATPHSQRARRRRASRAGSQERLDAQRPRRSPAAAARAAGTCGRAGGRARAATRAAARARRARAARRGPARSSRTRSHSWAAIRLPSV